MPTWSVQAKFWTLTWVCSLSSAGFFLMSRNHVATNRTDLTRTEILSPRLVMDPSEEPVVVAHTRRDSRQGKLIVVPRKEVRNRTGHEMGKSYSGGEGYAESLAASENSLFVTNCSTKGNTYCLPSPTHVLHTPRNICSPDVISPDVVILISSAYGNHYKRFIIRKTWAKLLPYYTGAIKYVFLLGSVAGGENQTAIDKEQVQTGDILQGHFMDTYRNLTLKTLMAYRWFRTECPSVRWLVKTDDDVYISPVAILDFVTSDMAAGGHTIVGTCTVKRPTPEFSENHRWYVPEDQYPDPIYPPYCCGCGYIITGNTARDAYDVMKWLPIFPLEDVFTGVALARLPYRVAFLNMPSRFPQQRYHDTMAECHDLLRGHVLAMHHVQAARTYLLTKNCKYLN